MSPPKKNMALANCVGSSGYQGVAILVTPSRLVSLLEKAELAPGEVQKGAKQILSDLTKGAWRISGGSGDTVEVLTAGGPKRIQLHTVSWTIHSIR
jgi:hypothetical protein